MKIKQKRWMKSVIEASRTETPALPFERSSRRPLAMRRGQVPVRKAA
ncbi:hypothetical protein [Oceanicola sp. 22II-s10i]|nr:hypothetical protein [Oceanicola sp. 22II-s10i]